MVIRHTAQCTRSTPRILCCWLAAAVPGLVATGCVADEASVQVTSASAALTTDPPVVFSQIFGGGGNSGAPYTHDFVELFNRSSAPVALDALSVQYASATGTGNFGANATLLATFPAGAQLQPGRYYLVQLGPGAGNGMPLPAADLVGPAISVNASAGKFALVTGATTLGCNGGSAPCDSAQEGRIIDLVGFGSANYAETAAAPSISNTTALVRAGGGCTDTNNNQADFSTGAPAPRNGSTAAAPCGGDAAPFIAATAPSNHAASVSTTVAVQITFSEAVTLSDPWFSFQCSLSEAIAAAVSGGPTVFTVTPPSPLLDGDDCTVQLSAAQIHDADSADPPDNLSADYSLQFTVGTGPSALAVHTVQGAAHLSPYRGQTLGVGPAIVTAVRSNGFYMQDPIPDADPATSEGIFVFTSSAPTVAAGAQVVVTGKITEFRPGCSSCTQSNSAYDNLTTTEIESPMVSVLSTGNPLPALTVLGSDAGQRAVPLTLIHEANGGDVETASAFNPASHGLDFYESLEGMRVQLDAPQIIDPTRSFSGTLEIGVLARADAGLRTARGGILLRASDPNPERLFLANTLTPSFPTVNVGDTFSGPVVGVLDYSFANYKLLVTAPLPAVNAGNLAPETTTLTAASPTQLTVASMNVENLDALDLASKFSQLAQIVVTRLGSPDLLALEEIQDNNGAQDNGVVDAASTLNSFVSAISSAGGPAYAYRQINPQNDQDGGEPGGNIRVVFLYRTDRGLAFVDRGDATSSTSNSVDASSGSPHLAFSPGRIDPQNAAWSSSRKPLAGEFTFSGKTLFAIANHFNSKGGDDPLSGRFQPPVLASETQRSSQATVLAGFVDTLLNADPEARVIALGDFNDFSFSAPLAKLYDVGLVDLVLGLPENERYTYVYQGNSQDLDHILVSPSLAARCTYDVVHVNAEFSVQASDHDPAVVRIELGDAPVFALSNPPASVLSGQPFSFQVSATGSPAPTFSLSAAPSGMSIQAQAGLVTWDTANSPPGPYSFTVRADNGVAQVEKTYAVSITAAAPGLPGRLAWLLYLLLAGCGVVCTHSARRSERPRGA